MKKFDYKKVGLGLIVVFVAIGLVGCGKETVEQKQEQGLTIKVDTNTTNWSVYEDKDFGFQFKYSEKYFLQKKCSGRTKKQVSI